MDDDRLSFHRQDLVQAGEKTISLVIRRRTGFTDAIFRKADSAPNKVITCKAFAEGPYGKSLLSFHVPAASPTNIFQIGKVDSLGSYGTVVLVAGGIGITHPVPFLRDLVEGYANGTIATRRVVLVWIVQSPGKLQPRLTRFLFVLIGRFRTSGMDSSMDDRYFGHGQATRDSRDPAVCN